MRAEGICFENEEVKEASVVRVKSGCGKAVQDEAEGEASSRQRYRL